MMANEVSFLSCWRVTVALSFLNRFLPTSGRGGGTGVGGTTPEPPEVSVLKPLNLLQ